MALLEVEDLTVDYYTDAGVVRAVDRLSYDLEAGETLGVVGESGAGKTTASLALLGLLGDRGEVVDGTIRFDGRNLLDLPPAERRAVRGNEIAIAFQNPETAFNPVYTVGDQIAEAVQVHADVPDREARRRAIDLLERVDVPAPGSRYTDYPHEFSGGMAQRAAVAMALACDPDLLILDEPTSGLDVTVGAQLLALLADLAADDEMAIQLVTHDLGVVAESCDRALVLYAGAAVERAPVEELFYDPAHPYTAGLLASIPRIGDGRDRLPQIPGTMPDPLERPTGCRFHPRCPYAEDVCATRDPPLVDVESGEADATGIGNGTGAKTVPAVVRGPAKPAGEHVAACHEYTGDLAGGLTYEVRVIDDDRTGEDGDSAADPADGTDDATRDDGGGPT